MNAVASADWQARRATWSERNMYLLENSVWTDCVFLVGTEELEQKTFACHKLLLSKTSPVFEAMLNGPLAETQQIHVTDITPQVFNLLLQYIYAEQISMPSTRVASDLCYAADKYMIPQLLKICLEYLDINLSPENVCHVYEVARMLEHRTFENKCFKMIQERTKEVLKFPIFDDIQFFTLLEIVRQDCLMLYSEARLIRASFRWAEKELVRQGKPINGPSLRNVLGTVLSKLRFLALTTKEFADGPACSDILTPEEKVTIFIKISSPGNEENLSDFFCSLNQDRNRPIIAIPKFSFSPERHTLMSGGSCQGMQSFVIFSANTSVVLVGVEVPTQERPDYAGTTYWESIDVTLQDSSYALVALATYREIATYNRTLDIKFPQPVVIYPDLKYKISVVFQASKGYYRKENGISKVSINHNIFLNESKIAIAINNPGFIRSIIYKKK